MAVRCKGRFKKTFRETLMSHLLIAGQVLEETLAFLLMFTALKPEFFMHFSLFAKVLKILWSRIVYKLEKCVKSTIFQRTLQAEGLLWIESLSTVFPLKSKIWQLRTLNWNSFTAGNKYRANDERIIINIYLVMPNKQVH